MAETALHSPPTRCPETDADTRLSLVEDTRGYARDYEDEWEDSDVRSGGSDEDSTLSRCRDSRDSDSDSDESDQEEATVGDGRCHNIDDFDVEVKYSPPSPSAPPLASICDAGSEGYEFKPTDFDVSRPDSKSYNSRTPSGEGVMESFDSGLGITEQSIDSESVGSGGVKENVITEDTSRLQATNKDDVLNVTKGDNKSRTDTRDSSRDIAETPTPSCDKRPDLTENCDLRSINSFHCETRPDIADVDDVILDIDDCSDAKPDVVDINVRSTCCPIATAKNYTSNEINSKPDIVEDYSDVIKKNTQVNCDVGSEMSEQCEGSMKVCRGTDTRPDNIDVLNHGFDPPDVTDIGEVSTDADSSSDIDDVVPNASTFEEAKGDVVVSEVEVDGDSTPGSVGHLLKLVRALANNLGAEAAAPGSGGGNTNLGFEDTENLGRGRTSDDRLSQTSSNEDIDWSWLADETQLCAASSRPSSWLRASMRRVRRFALGEPQVRVVSAPSSNTLPPSVASAVAARCSAPPIPTGDDVPAQHHATDDNEIPSNSRVRNNPRPHRSHSVNNRPSPRDIPDILPSVNTTRSIVPPSRCVSARLPRPSSFDTSNIVPDNPSVYPLDDDLLSPTPSAPPESPRIPRDPDDFPRRYSHLGRLEGRRPEETPDQPSEPTTEDESNSEYDEPEESKNCWPHSLSSLLASLGCTLGLFNVSRFAILSVHFGANFVIQFLFLSLVVGWPLYTLHASLGQHLKAGVVDMWRISPLFQGIGIALLLAQAMIGLYSVVGVAWLFTYFRDSFINKYDAYRWAENGTKIEESVPEYLNTIVLQREGSSTVGHLKFQVTFNLAVVWMIVFVCLSKGVRSYGKSVYLFATIPIFGISILAIKVLTLTDIWFDHTAWNELFMNANCWTAAAIECVMTWGLLGAATMQMRSHSACCRLSRECLAVGAITLATLVSAALLANGFSQLLWSNNLRYVPSSFEHSAVFLSPLGAPRLSSTPVRWMAHGHHIVGLRVALPGAPSETVSGYQAAQFATELAPAVFAKLGPQSVSPFWIVLFYFTLILLGISQQLCIWHCVITGIMAINITRLRSWETTITFLSCSCGFVLGLPMTTELGVAVVYFIDYCVGGAWWLILLQAAQIIAALMAQGGEHVAHTLLGSRRSCLQAFVVFTWNVVLPLALTVVSVTWFRSNQYRDLYSSRHHGYWPAWARRLGCLLQLVPLVIVPLVAAVQTWRYLTKGPSDLFDRLRLLCRPGPADISANQTPTPTVSVPSQPLPEITAADDPPPKYTPPPSYSTATGARIAKMLRRSFRRLVGPSAPSPPDYSAVLVEMGGAQTVGRTSTMSAVEVAHILRSSMRRTLRREHVQSAPSPAQDSSKTEPVI